MGTQGIAQIVFYSVALVALGYPLGTFMARAYTRERLDPVERAFLRLLGRCSGEDVELGSVSHGHRSFRWCKSCGADYSNWR